MSEMQIIKRVPPYDQGYKDGLAGLEDAYWQYEDYLSERDEDFYNEGFEKGVRMREVISKVL